MTVPTAEQIATFLANTDPTKIGRLDEPPAAFAAARSFTLRRLRPNDPPPTRPSSDQWNAYAMQYAADPLCAAQAIGMTVIRDSTEGTTVITYFWAAA